MARNLAKGRVAREQRRASAEERRVERSKRSAADQVKRLDRAGHRAVRERARLFERCWCCATRGHQIDVCLVHKIIKDVGKSVRNDRRDRGCCTQCNAQDHVHGQCPILVEARVKVWVVKKAS